VWISLYWTCGSEYAMVNPNNTWTPKREKCTNLWGHLAAKVLTKLTDPLHSIWLGPTGPASWPHRSHHTFSLGQQNSKVVHGTSWTWPPAHSDWRRRSSALASQISLSWLGFRRFAVTPRLGEPARAHGQDRRRPAAGYLQSRPTSASSHQLSGNFYSPSYLQIARIFWFRLVFLPQFLNVWLFLPYLFLNIL
jgi:hypothetical protein